MYVTTDFDSVSSSSFNSMYRLSTMVSIYTHTSFYAQLVPLQASKCNSVHVNNALFSGWSKAVSTPASKSNRTFRLPPMPLSALSFSNAINRGSWIHTCCNLTACRVASPCLCGRFRLLSLQSLQLIH